MKNAIVLNNKNRTIELTKKFAAASSVYGSEEYKMLQEARRDYPTYRVVTVSKKSDKAKKNMFKGLTYEYMKLYIEKHDDEEKTIMTKFKTLRGQVEMSEALEMESESYFTIKAWFLGQFPEIGKFQEQRDAITEVVYQKQKEEREAKREAALMARRAALLAKIG